MQVSEKISLEKVDKIIHRYNSESECLIQILLDISSEYNYLPQSCLRRVTEKLNVPLSEVFSAATFYKAFSLKPRGKHLIHVCLGTACHVRGAPQVLSKIERKLNIKAGQTSKDLKFTLETVNCLGACALGPVVVIDGDYHGQMTQAKVERLLGKYVKPGGANYDVKKS